MKRLQLPLLVLLLASACDSPAPDASVGTTAFNVLADPDEVVCPEGVECVHSQQGRSLLGITPAIDKLRLAYGSARWGSLAVTQPPLESVTIGATGFNVRAGGHLLTPEELIGLELQDEVSAVPFRIAALWPPDALNRSRYLVEFKQAETWVPLCPNGDYAYAIPGTFASLTFSIFTPELDHGMFACGTSAAAKAMRWGLGPTGHGMHFSAAVRMARAEYCANGIPHTVDGTSVALATLDGTSTGVIADDGTTPGTNAGAFYFEAAWHGRGADFVSSFAAPPPDFAVVCLSKLRWQSLPPGGFCPNKVPDPRLATEFYHPTVFCDDLPGFPADQTVSAPFLTYMRDTYGATLASMSQFNDRGLWAWNADSGNDMLTTSEGFWAGTLSRSGTERPKAGYGLMSPTFVSRVLTSAPARAGTARPLYVYRNRNTGDYRTTTARLDYRICGPLVCLPPPPWVRQGGALGWIYVNATDVPEGQTPIPLRQWVRKVNGTIVDTVLLGDTQESPAGYEPESTTGAVEGYGF
jgi:hypothetical protein